MTRRGVFRGRKWAFTQLQPPKILMFSSEVQDMMIRPVFKHVIPMQMDLNESLRQWYECRHPSSRRGLRLSKKGA